MSLGMNEFHINVFLSEMIVCNSEMFQILCNLFTSFTWLTPSKNKSNNWRNEKRMACIHLFIDVFKKVYFKIIQFS